MENSFSWSCFGIKKTLLKRMSCEPTGKKALPPSQGSRNPKTTCTASWGTFTQHQPVFGTTTPAKSQRMVQEAIGCHDPVGHPMGVNTSKISPASSLPSNPLPVGPVPACRAQAVRSEPPAPPRLINQRSSHGPALSFISESTQINAADGCRLRNTAFCRITWH